MCRSHSLLIRYSKRKEKSKLQHADQISGIGAARAGALSTAADYKSGGLPKFRAIHSCWHPYHQLDSQVHVLSFNQKGKGRSGEEKELVSATVHG